MKNQLGSIYKEDGYWKLQLSKHIESFATKKMAQEFWDKSVEVKAPWVKPIKQVVKVLDYEITNTGNGDGWVLSKPDGELWECHLGNFESAEHATKWAIYSYMIARPSIFHAIIRNKAMGFEGCFHEYSTLLKQVKQDGLQMPSCIMLPEDSNRMIKFFPIND